MDINSRNLGQQEEDLDKKKFRKRASMSRPSLQSCTAIIPNMKCDASASVTAARAVNGSSRKFTVPGEGPYTTLQ